MGIIFNYGDRHTTNAPVTGYDQLYKLQCAIHIEQRIINGSNILRVLHDGDDNENATDQWLQVVLLLHR